MATHSYIKYTTLNRRGYEIVLPTHVYNQLSEKNINVGLSMKGNSMTVQCTKDKQYLGTLKQYMGVSGFKNGNPCDFHVRNLILAD